MGNIKKDQSISFKQDIPAAILGGGYSSDRQMPGEYICVNKGNVSYSGNSESFVDMGASVDFETVLLPKFDRHTKVTGLDMSASLETLRPLVPAIVHRSCSDQTWD